MVFASGLPIGPACHAVIESLFANRVLDNLRAAQGVIGLGESFGRVRLEAACARAVSFGVPKYSPSRRFCTTAWTGKSNRSPPGA